MKQLIFLILVSMFISNGYGQVKDSVYLAKMEAPGVKLISIREGKYKLWSQKIGNGNIKLLLLHGGPGTSPEYFENFPAYLGGDYTIYYYSQLGTYLSDQPTDTSLASVELFAEDVEEVRIGLGLDTFYLLGHSWGGLLAEVYAAKYQHHLKGLIVCNTDIYSLGENQEYQGVLIADIIDSLPDYKQYGDSVRYNMLTYNSNPELMNKIMKVVWPIFIKKHYCRLDALPDPLWRSKKHSSGGSNMVTRYLTYKMNQFDFEPYIKQITVPVLFLGSKYDYMPPWNYAKMKDEMDNENVDIYICPKGAHFDMWDDTDVFFGAIKTFIDKTEK